MVIALYNKVPSWFENRILRIPPLEILLQMRKNLRAISKLVRPMTAFCSRAWPSYVLILLLQIKVIWRIWELHDIPYGDTAHYFKSALTWSRGFYVNVLWAPLYSSFYGTLLFATDDVYNVTILHRVVIVLLIAVGVLFVLRQILSPGLALLGAAWWAILPINYDALSEVHQFALLPILLAWALILGSATVWARAAALAILVSSVVLVRNEFVVAAIVMALLCVTYEWRHPQKATTYLAAYGTSLTVAVMTWGLFYWRSVIKFPAIWPHLELKHTINMCQVFAYGYQQRHPSWNASPWTDCQDLAQQMFGTGLPSISQMLWANPKATLDHFLWNISLVPNGMEALLFNAMGGGFQPDYLPIKVATYPLVLGPLVLLVLVLGIVLAFREQRNPWSWLFGRMTLAFLPFLVMAIPIVLTQRPRPSYLFSVSIIVMAMVLWTLYRILQRRPRLLRTLDAGSFVLAIVLIVLMPTYSLPPYLASGRPVLAKLEHLTPQRAMLLAPHGRVILGDWDSDVAAYLDLPLSVVNPYREERTVFNNTLLRSWDKNTPLEQFLAEQQVTILYLDPSELARLRLEPLAKTLLENPRIAGWRDLGHEDRGARSWMLLAKD